jgi:hypothetical protein
MNAITIPMTGAARMTPVEPDIRLPGEPAPPLPRPGEQPSPFSS